MTSPSQGQSAQNNPSYWKVNKSDFFPGESFQSWNAYKSAVSQTCLRFKDRLTSRSDDAIELSGVREQSRNDMKRCLNWWDIWWFGIGSVIGAGVFVLTGQEAHIHAGPSIVMSYALSGFSVMLSVFCYTEFAVEIPVAGGSFSYLRVALGDFAAFIAAGNILLEGYLANALAARAWTSYFTTLLNHHPNSFRIHTHLKDGFNLLDPIAVGVLLITSALATASTKIMSILNWNASVIYSVVILFVIITGISHGKSSNLSPFFPYKARGTFQGAATVFFTYLGFDNLVTMAEETKNPPRDIPIGLLGSMSCITVVYCLMALSLSMTQPFTEIDTNAAYSVAFQSMGLKWVKYVVALGALKGITTALLTGTLGEARYTTHMARAHMIPPWFAQVHQKTGTPAKATLLNTILSACIAFFISLDQLSSLSTISVLLIFVMMAVAVIVRRYYVRGVTPRRNLLKLIVLLLIIIVASMGAAACWALNPHGWLGYAITIPCWFFATMAISILLPQQHRPKFWGVPCVPWVPSLSIALNVFLMGSLEAKAFIRFGICTAVMLIYYLIFGLHTTYDMAQQQVVGAMHVDPTFEL